MLLRYPANGVKSKRRGLGSGASWAKTKEVKKRQKTAGKKSRIGRRDWLGGLIRRIVAERGKDCHLLPVAVDAVRGRVCRCKSHSFAVIFVLFHLLRCHNLQLTAAAVMRMLNAFCRSTILEEELWELSPGSWLGLLQ